MYTCIMYIYIHAHEHANTGLFLRLLTTWELWEFTHLTKNSQNIYIYINHMLFSFSSSFSFFFFLTPPFIQFCFVCLFVFISLLIYFWNSYVQCCCCFSSPQILFHRSLLMNTCKKNPKDSLSIFLLTACSKKIQGIMPL